jgi:phosphoesterase RecJ-like protein
MIQMKDYEITVSEIKKRINKSQKILVTSHIHPDGDAIGSLLGLGLALLESGKKVQMVLADGVPGACAYLPGQELIQKRLVEKYDLAIILDSSDLNRIGNVLEPFNSPDINIDHHLTNDNFADLNLIISDAVSTTEILAKIIPLLGLIINLDVAQNLLAGMITDTIGFRTPNVKPDTMRIAADLMETGADLTNLYSKALNRKTYSAIRLWGYGLSNLERQGEMIWTTLTMVDRNSSGYPGRDDADLINILSAVEDTKVNMVFVEQPDGHVKVSWRSIPGYDVAQVAMLYGGGGHAAAAGAEIKGNLENIRHDVIRKTYEILFCNN